MPPSPGRKCRPMHTNAAGAAAVRAAFASLIDYAGLFPPAQLSMESAVPDYVEAHGGSFSWMLGRFIVPASRLDDLVAALPDEVVPLSVILDAGSDSRTWLSNVQRVFATLTQVRGGEPRVRIEALELVLPALQTDRETYDATIGQYAAAAQQAGMRDLPAFVELPRDKRWEKQLHGALAALARHRLGAKVRCGGLVPEAVPTPAEIAQFIAAASEERVPYKATAGLHHPIRHFNEAAGFTMHGFLNVLTAAVFARDGRPSGELEQILAGEDADAFAFDGGGLRWNDSYASAADIEAARRENFIGYGSCSFSEPIEDLQKLGLL